MTSYSFDRATALASPSDGTLTGELSSAWNIGRVPNGGYQLAMMGRAAREALGTPHILNATAYYIGASAPGPAALPVEVVKVGRSTSLAEVRLVQDGREKVRGLFLGGDLEAFSGPDLETAPPAELPPPEACLHMSPALPMTPALMREVEIRLDPATAAFAQGRRGEAPVLRGHVRFTDGRPIDALSLLCLADVFPPTSFNLYGLTGWVPTLELTVQVRRVPAAGPWVRVAVTTRHVTGGHFEEDGEIRDSDGRLVAIFRQRAMLLEGRPAAGAQ